MPCLGALPWIASRRAAALAAALAVALTVLVEDLQPQTVTADTVLVRMPDAVGLRTIVTRPAAPGRHPVILVRSPYEDLSGGGMGWFVERMSGAGYAVVVQSVRGLGGSEGQFVPFVHERADGLATLEWLSQQPWSGRVGLWGISYLGFSALALAQSGHPSLHAAVVGSAWSDLDEFLSPGGSFHLMAHLPWLMLVAGDGRLPPAEVFPQIFATLPLRTFFPRDTAFEQAIPRYDAAGVSVPVLHVTGWYDYTYAHSLRAYRSIRANAASWVSARQDLIVGPWAHNGELTTLTRVTNMEFGPASRFGVDSVVAVASRFFGHYLRDEGPPKAAGARVFFLGDNAWRDFPSWPPPDAATQALFIGRGAALEGTAAPEAHAESFWYDPMNPMPTLGGVVVHFFPNQVGPLDQSPLRDRTDVLRFAAPPLARSRSLAGPIRAVLWVTADAPTTDLTARLVVVAADGTERIVEEGLRRVTFNGAGPQQVIIELGDRAWTLPAGTRLRLDVSGGSFPKWARNPNTEEDPFDASVLRPVRIWLHGGRALPSRLELSWLPD